MEKLSNVALGEQRGVCGFPSDVQGRSCGRVRLADPRGLLSDERGQGTTEYAILVGVLVVIAILAIIAFKGKVQELWDAIVNGMNAL